MPIIHLETFIVAPKTRVFDLCRSIDAHMDTTEHTGERAVGRHHHWLTWAAGRGHMGGEALWHNTKAKSEDDQV